MDIHESALWNSHPHAKGSLRLKKIHRSQAWQAKMIAWLGIFFIACGFTLDFFGFSTSLTFPTLLLGAGSWLMGTIAFANAIRMSVRATEHVDSAFVTLALRLNVSHEYLCSQELGEIGQFCRQRLLYAINRYDRLREEIGEFKELKSSNMIEPRLINSMGAKIESVQRYQASKLILLIESLHEFNLLPLEYQSVRERISSSIM